MPFCGGFFISRLMSILQSSESITDSLRHENRLSKPIVMDDSSYRLNFDLGKKNGYGKWYKFLHVIQKYTKFAKFAGLYFPHFTTFRDQTLQFY